MDYNLRNRYTNPTTIPNQIEEVSLSYVAEGAAARASAEPQALSSCEIQVVLSGNSSVAGPEAEVPSGEKTRGSDTSDRPMEKR